MQIAKHWQTSGTVALWFCFHTHIEILSSYKLLLRCCKNPPITLNNFLLQLPNSSPFPFAESGQVRRSGISIGCSFLLRLAPRCFWSCIIGDVYANTRSPSGVQGLPRFAEGQAERYLILCVESQWTRSVPFMKYVRLLPNI